MFERFHPEARAAVAHAQDEATRSGHREIGTEHLLLGLLARPGHAADALTAAGADVANLRAGLPGREAEQPEPDGEPASDGEMRMTREAKRALELASRAAHRLRHQHVSSGHMLLGIIDQPGTPAVEALTVAGIHVGTLRADVLQRLERGPPEPGTR